MFPNSKINPTQISFNCYSLRVINNPITEDKKDNKFKWYTILVSISDLPKELTDWLDINPRRANTDNVVSKEIRSTLVNAPEVFFIRNRGLTIIAQYLDFDNKTNHISLTMSDKKLHGLLDGGHTFEVIQDYQSNTNQPNQAFVKLEILTGFGSDDNNNIDGITNIVRARNKSTQVPESSLKNLDGNFDRIKEVLSSQKYFDRIAFKDNEINDNGKSKDIEILDILSYLVCFDIFNYPDSNKAPTVAYSSKGTIPNKFDKEEYCENIKKLTPLLPDILLLRDRIIKELPDNWKYENGTRSGFGNLKEVGGKLKQNIILPFSGDEVEYEVASSYYYPILASFRDLIDFDQESQICTWKYPINEVFDQIFDNIVKDVREKRNGIDNLNQLGKDKSLWTACWKTMNGYLQERALKDEERKNQDQAREIEELKAKLSQMNQN